MINEMRLKLIEFEIESEIEIEGRKKRNGREEADGVERGKKTTTQNFGITIFSSSFFFFLKKK